MNEICGEKIRLYARQLHLPSIARYADIIRQLPPDAGYDEFLERLLRKELDERYMTGQKRRQKAAGFPYVKTLDEFDMSRLAHVSPAAVAELSSCDFVKNRENVVMIGNPGSGKTHLAIALGKTRTFIFSNKAPSLASDLNLKETITTAVRND